jgi:hypothetical protein
MQDRVRQKIREIAAKRKNVTLAEIEWVMEELKATHSVRTPKLARHGKLYGIDSARFMVCTHHPGSKQVTSCYVDAFINAMIEIGEYED